MEVWGELLDTVKETEVREVVKKALSNHASTCPSELQRELAELLTPKVRWQDVLRDTFSQNITALRESTHHRLNRRMPFIYQGSKCKPQLDVLVIVDTSGSMGEGQGSLLMDAASEIKGIAELVGGSLTLVSCDAKAVITQLDSPSDIKLEGGGGTMLEAAFRAVAEMDKLPSQIVCLTDGYNYGDITDIGIPTTFAIVGGHDKCEGANFGTILLIKLGLGNRNYK